MKRRASLAELLGMVAVFAAGFAAVRDGSPVVLSAFYTATFIALLTALVGAWVGPAPRPGCRGFAVFGWAYFLVGCVPAIQSTIGSELPTVGWLQGIGFRFHRSPVVTQSLVSQFLGTKIDTSADELALRITMQRLSDPEAVAFSRRYQDYITRGTNGERIGHLLLYWLFGMAGLILGRFLAFRGQTASSAVP